MSVLFPQAGSGNDLVCIWVGKLASKREAKGRAPTDRSQLSSSCRGVYPPPGLLWQGLEQAAPCEYTLETPAPARRPQSPARACLQACPGGPETRPPEMQGACSPLAEVFGTIQVGMSDTTPFRSLQ